MEENRKLLNEAIEKQLLAISEMEAASDKRSKAIDELCKLYRLKTEESKIEGELDEKQLQRFADDSHAEDEAELKREQLKEQKTDRWFRVGIAAGELILPLIFYGCWISKGLRFEETGSITSTTFRGLITKFRPTK